MKIIRWAAVAVTVLFALMNLGAAIDADQTTWVRAVGIGLGLAGAAAAVGLALNLGWGRPSVIGVGALNVAASIVGMATDTDGFAIGLVVGGLGVLLGALAGRESENRVAAAR